MMETDYSSSRHNEFVGVKANELPTPSVVISLPKVKKNIAALHRDIETKGIPFRPHVKTLKVRSMSHQPAAYGCWAHGNLPETRGIRC
jgi:D-serine deaminase-like pyridoxal phosphate-dependent protein